MNIDAVLAQTQKYLESKEGKRMLSKAASGGAPAAEIKKAGDDLAKKISSQIPDSLSGSIAMSSSVEFGDDGIATITITMSGPLARPSLNPDKYPEGVYDIVGLFSKGWSYDGFGPSGIWHGRITYALTHRNAAPFIARAVNEWVSSCGLPIKSFTIDPKYT